MFRYLKLKKTNYFAVLIMLGVANISFAQESNQQKAKPVAEISKTTNDSEIAPVIKKEIFTNGEFEIVVSSYQNNGVKTIIVTRNRNGSFYDRTEWVGKGEVPDELNWLMGKGEPGNGTKMKEKSYFGVMVKDATQADTKVACRYFRGRSLAIEKVTLGKLPKGTGLNLKSIDGGEIIDTRAVRQAQRKPKTTAKGGSGAKLMPTKSNMSLTNFNCIKTAGGWLNVSFNAPEVPITMIVFDGQGKEVFHQHLPWFKGNYKQLIKIKPGIEGPFSVIAAQGSSVYSKEVK